MDVFSLIFTGKPAVVHLSNLTQSALDFFPQTIYQRWLKIEVFFGSLLDWWGFCEEVLKARRRQIAS